MLKRVLWKRYVLGGVVGLTMVGMLIWLYVTPIGGVGIPCLWQKWTGWYCSGCGLTRAGQELMHGRLYAAFRMNPLVIGGLPFWIWLLVCEGYRLSTGRPLWRYDPLPLPAIGILVAVIVLFTIARNIPVKPFSYLAPTIIP